MLYVTYICQWVPAIKKKKKNTKLNIPKNEQIQIVEA